MSAEYGRMIPIAIAILGLTLQAPAFGAGPEARPMEIYFVDVLGGAATLIHQSESILIDSGWPNSTTATPGESFTCSRTWPAAITLTI